MLEPLVEKPKAIPVPNEQFDAIASAIKEEEQRPIKWVTPKFIAHDRVQPVVLFAKIHGLGIGKHRNLGGEA